MLATTERVCINHIGMAGTATGRRTVLAQFGLAQFCDLLGGDLIIVTFFSSPGVYAWVGNRRRY